MAYKQEDKLWFGQNIISFKDECLGKEYYAGVFINSSTTDFTTFSSPTLNLHITSNVSKVCIMNFQQCVEYINSVKACLSDMRLAFEENLKILKKYNKKFDFITSFLINKNKEKYVLLEFKSSTSDISLISLKLNSFKYLCNIINKFIEDYINISLSMNTNFLLREIYKKNCGIEKNIIELPSYLNPLNINNKMIQEDMDFERGMFKETKEEPDSELDSAIEFSEFLKEHLEKVDLKIDISKVGDSSTPSQSVDYDSILLKNLFLGSISGLENLLFTAQVERNPILFINQNICNILDSDSDLLEGLDSDSLKSLIYLSDYIFTVSNLRYLELSENYPSNNSVLKFKPPRDLSKIEKDAILDLAVIFIYLYLYTRRIGDKTDDINFNKSALYFCFSNFFSPFIFSYIDIFEKEFLKNSIINRFENYDKSGFFDVYNSILDIHNCKKVESIDIPEVLDKLLNNIYKNDKLLINNFHKALFENNTVFLENINTVKLEELKDFVILEANYNLGRNEKKSLEKIADQNKISKEILDMVFERKKNKKRKNPIIREKKNSIIELSNQYRNEIPEHKQKVFSVFIDDHRDRDINFKRLREFVGIEELGENILKMLYLWKPEEDPKIKHDIKYFFNIFESDPVTKEYILEALNNTVTNSEDSGDNWSEIL